MEREYPTLGFAVSPELRNDSSFVDHLSRMQAELSRSMQAALERKIAGFVDFRPTIHPAGPDPLPAQWAAKTRAAFAETRRRIRHAIDALKGATCEEDWCDY